MTSLARSRRSVSPLFLLSLGGFLVLLFGSPRPHLLKPPLSHGVGRPLYAGLKACTQLKVTARHIRLFPRRSHDEFGEVPAERLPYAHGA